MTTPAEESDERLLDVRVLEIQALTAQQQRVIKTLDLVGRDSSAARKVLDELLAMQRLREAELEALRKKLAQPK
jgi:hypothetical protein